jgi:hypothetical protein
MSSIPLKIRRKAKSVVEAGKTSAEVKGFISSMFDFSVSENNQYTCFSGATDLDNPLLHITCCAEFSSNTKRRMDVVNSRLLNELMPVMKRFVGIIVTCA